jgi:predicted ATP-binding protein involved in virulence
VQAPDSRFSRSTQSVVIGAVICALIAAAAAWLGGRPTSYGAGPPSVTIDARARAIWFLGDDLVVIQIDRLKVQRWRASTGPTPGVFDLNALTRRRVSLLKGAEQPDYTAVPSTPLGAGQDDSYGRTETQVPVRPDVAIGPDGDIAAWTVEHDLFVSPLDVKFVPFWKPLEGKKPGEADCVPQFGTAALVLACRDNHVEFRDIHNDPGSLRGSIQLDSTPVLVQDRGSVFVLSGSDIFEVRNAAEPYTRVNVNVGKSPRAIARSDATDVAVSSSDGRVVVAMAGGSAVDVKTPGVADAMAFLPSAGLLVGGAFRGIYLLKTGAEPAVFVPDVVGVRAIAVRADRVAYATADTVRMAPVVVTRSFNGFGKSLLAVAAFFLVGGLAYAFMPRRVREAADRGVAAVTALDFTLPLPDPPPGLITACMQGDCVLYAGAGLSAQAGYPTWQPFVERLLERAIALHKIDAGFAESLRVSLKSGQADPVADALVSALGRDEALKVLAEVFGTDQKIPDAHRLLKRIPLCGALTTNFDTLLERTYPEAADRVFTPKDAERLIDVLGRRSFFIAKLYGRLSAPESVLLAPAEYAETVARSLAFSQFMEGLFVSRTLVFIGASLEGIEAYLSGLTFRGQMTRPHYALVAVTDAGWRAKADLLSRRYGIEVLPYTAGPGLDEITKFLERVVAATTATAGTEKPARTTGHGKGLKRLQLTNIGPFPELSLDLQSDWNVLLGDNGVGKSTILKAISACFCGKDIEPYAGRLVRAGEPSGTITLETTQNTYRMEIKARENATAEVSVLPTRPLEVEGILALGFPALRAVSWERPKGPTAEGRGRATVEDLIPIVKGDPDPRLDRLKQWIVNLDSRIHYERTKGGDTRYERLLARFFEIVDEVTPGMSIRFGRVNQDTRAVSVITDDGEVPIELISQGSVSLMGWIGVLLQRLYEIYGDQEDPTKSYALVLIDEIDAHMHPEWQQSIVFDMSRIFPNVQFVATTHSPLVVSGLKGLQVLRFMRDKTGHAVQVTVSDDMLVGRADQILTGRLFGMQTTLDQRTQQSMELYKTLLGKQSRTPQEEAEFQRLNRELKFKIPNAEETAPERKAFALVEAIVNDQIAGSVPEARKPLLDKAKSLLDEVSRSKTGAQ